MATTRRSRSKPREAISAYSLVAVAALTAAFSSVAYELLLASYATFLMGATIFQYTLVFSLMMASMGAGALAAEKIRRDPWTVLIGLEIAIALAAIAAVPTLYWVFAWGGPAQPLLFFFVVVMGAGLGMEVPLLNRVEKQQRWLTQILFYDYLGGFAGGLAFPFFFLPYLGFFRLAALLALVNALVALGLAWKAPRRSRAALWLSAAVVLLALIYAAGSEALRVAMESQLFGVVSQ